jgi:hypothetical protein
MSEGEMQAYYTLAMILLLAKLEEMANAPRVQMQYKEA